MNPPKESPRKILRCAIYTRKSTEEQATNVRTRINEAIERAPIGDFARRAAGLQSQIPLAKTQKQQNLDDGVSLP